MRKINEKKAQELFGRGCDKCGGDFKDNGDFNFCPNCARWVCNHCADKCRCGETPEPAVLIRK